MKENILQTFCFHEVQDGTGMDRARSLWKLLHIKVGLSPFLLMNLYLILLYNSCTATTLSCHFEIQSILVISTSVISNNRLSRRENLIPVLT